MQPTKVQAVFMGIFALALLTNNTVPVMFEDRHATVGYWIAQTLDVALLLMSIWWFRRASKTPPTRS